MLTTPKCEEEGVSTRTERERQKQRHRQTDRATQQETRRWDFQWTDAATLLEKGGGEREKGQLDLYQTTSSFFSKVGFEVTYHLGKTQ